MTDASPGNTPARRWTRWHSVAVYVLMLVASQAVRFVQLHRVPESGDFKVARVRVVDRGHEGDRTIGIAYKDFGPASATGMPVVVLHGSPIQSFDLARFSEALAAGGRRVLLPDLPGFGASLQALPDYSIAAHARYVRQLIDSLGLGRVHLVAYSMGGGVALELAATEPERIASISLVSSIGVQELELLGTYELNHALHGIQLGALWLLNNAVPHFGWLDGMMFNVPYARNFYDTDQRPLRGMLEQLEAPTLIVHGREDILVPPGAAREHARLVPQSELLWIDGGHVSMLYRPERVAPLVDRFLDRVDRGEGVARAMASDERKAAAAKPFDASVVEHAVGMALVVLMTLIALGTFISEDLACIGAGLLAAHGILSYEAAAFAAFAGIFFGDIGLYLAGRWIGAPAVRRPPVRWFVKESALEESERWFEEKGPIVIILSRFVPGSRLPTYFAAGMLRANFLKFVVYFFVAGVVWAPLLVWLSMTLGGKLVEYLHAYTAYTLLAVGGAALLLWLVTDVVIPLFSFKGRRLLLSSWRRKTRWEFWPLWLFYPPILVYIAGRMIRHRSIAVFTASNPAMPFGGFLGESKIDILRGLAGAGDAIAAWEPIPADASTDDALRIVRSFVDRTGGGFPIVIKPDVGQRGLGVLVAKSDDDVRSYYATKRPRALVQAFAPGHEFGVFYTRHPGDERGRIFAITEKRFPVIRGDGVSTVERLILQDDRAVCMARTFLHSHRERLYDVLPEGETLPLVELGTHCRGAMFLDGIWVRTPELEEAIDRISKTYDGFFFGRYDIRTPSIEDFQKGRNFKIVELNGVSSEATSIYDPSHSVFHGWRTLMTQWRIAFEIGATNRAKGVKPATARELLRSILEYQASPEAR